MKECDIELCNYLLDFINLNKEFQNEDYGCPKVCIVDNIYETVVNDEWMSSAFFLTQNIEGLLYVSNNNEIIIYLKTTDLQNSIYTFFHEYVHYVDFMNLSKFKKENNFRKLQEDPFFILWSEFHATFLTYKYYYNAQKNLDMRTEYKDIEQTIKKELQKNPKEINAFMNFYSRIVGRYYAFSLFVDKTFLLSNNILDFDFRFRKIFNFLIQHTTFDSIKCEMDCLHCLFLELEN